MPVKEDRLIDFTSNIIAGLSTLILRTAIVAVFVSSFRHFFSSRHPETFSTRECYLFVRDVALE
jgi:hypothetical protein